jgi:hypothetical protein
MSKTGAENVEELERMTPWVSMAAHWRSSFLFLMVHVPVRADGDERCARH